MLTKIALGSTLILALVVGYLGWRNAVLDKRNSELVVEVADLKADNKSKDTTITALGKREQNSKQIEAEYENLIKELSSEENGAVAPVLRRAIASDVVR